MNNKCRYFKNNLSLIISLFTLLISITANFYLYLQAIPAQVRSEFYNKWQTYNIIYEKIKEAGKISKSQLYKYVMEHNKRKNIEEVSSDISNIIYEMISTRVIERDKDGLYSLSPPISDSIEKSMSPYKPRFDIENNKKIILDMVKEISFENSDKFTLREIYNLITDRGINIDWPTFEILVYSNVTPPGLFPYPYDGYNISEDGKFYHYAARRFKPNKN